MLVASTSLHALPACRPPTALRPCPCSRLIGEQVYLALAIFLSVMCVLVVWLHYQFGATFFTFHLCWVTVLYCLIGTIFLLVAAVGNDG